MCRPVDLHNWTLSVRHNHAMNVAHLRRLSHGCLIHPGSLPGVLCLALLVACDGGIQGTSQHDVPPMDPGAGGIQWRGSLACTDCEGIDTVLSLQRRGEEGSYTLTETYLTADGDVRFVDTGHWQRDGDLLRLQGLHDGRRVYALLADGRLQPRDGQGRHFQPREHDFLLPVADSQAP